MIHRKQNKQHYQEDYGRIDDGCPLLEVVAYMAALVGLALSIVAGASLITRHPLVDSTGLTSLILALSIMWFMFWCFITVAVGGDDRGIP